MKRSILLFVASLGLLSPLAPFGCVRAGVTSPGSTGGAATAIAEPDATPSAAWLHALDHGAEHLAPGELEVRDLDRQIDRQGAGQFLALTALKVDVKVVGPMARYEVEHVFENPGDEVLEGTFRFPLPHAAIVTGLAMEIDGKLQNGEIVEREKARRIYEEIVDSMRDPALLEWEAGQTFKLRVFPINPGEKKRVVMRYYAPLVPDADASSGLAVAIPSATPAMQASIPELRVIVDGKAIVDARDHAAADHLRVPLAKAEVPSVVEEVHDGRRYLAARLDLDWSKVPSSKSAADTGTRRAVIVVDSSRSALESWALAQQSVERLLEGLGPDAEFMVLAADLEAQAFAPSFSANTPARRAEALAFLAGLDPDGASDLGAALELVGASLASLDDPRAAAATQVIYIGDGTPTWGLTAPDQLVAASEAALAGASLHVLSVGKRESRDLLELLAGHSGGRTVRPQTLDQVQAFADFLERAPTARQLAAVEIEIDGVDSVHAPLHRTWFEGERPSVVLALAEDAPAPKRVVVRGRAGGRPFEQVLALPSAVPLAGVRQQWAARELVQTTDKAAAVALSVEHSVLSKHTALLVLESEEAYERYEIERRNGPQPERDENGDPTISGRDLDGGDDSPYLGPGDLQPGDPEVHIPAPRDAVSVDVVFPFGETKAARWEQELGQWTVRFLVDDDTAPGVYEVLVRVTHADGRVELLELEYTIDVAAPELRLELRARDDGAYDVYAEQVLNQADAARERAEGRIGDGDEQAMTLDARRVELIMPDGQTLTLRRGLPGQFVRRWAPQAEIEWPATVTAVVADRALNSRRVELVLDGPSGGPR